MNQLTGNRRYRMGGMFRTKLILQVQYKDHELVGQDFERVLRWRDARVEDLMMIEAVHRPFPVVERT